MDDIDLRKFVGNWSAPQVLLPEVIRWGPRVESEGVRRQSTLEHTHGLVWLGMTFIERLRPFGGVKHDYLVICALQVHDHGEGHLGKDTLLADKTWRKDPNEYDVYIEPLLDLDDGTFEHLHRAFLLQFALSDAHFNGFPSTARAVMQDIRNNYRVEAHLFDALENFDYMMFAFEQYFERGKTAILVEVVEHAVPKLDRLAKQIPGFEQAIWTPQFRADLLKMVEVAKEPA